MAALPKESAANDKLISSTPYNQLTDRQKRYADLHGLTLLPPSPGPGKGAWMNPGPGYTGGPNIPANLSDNVTLPTTPGGTASATDALGGAAKVAKDLADRDADAYIKDVLDMYGLGTMSGWAWGEIQNGRTNAEVLQDLRATQQFKDRFPAIAAREQYNLANPGSNLPPISPGEYVSYEKAYQQLVRSAGLPQGFLDSQDTVTKLLTGNVSIPEMTQRIENARVATYELGAEGLARLDQMHGLAPGSGPVTALFLDPTQAEPLLKRDLLAAQIGGQADRTGYAGLANTTAQTLAQSGVSAQQAQSGFSQLQHDNPLYSALPGSAERQISQQEQLGAVFDQNAEDQRLIEDRRRGRLSQFADQGAGGFAGTAQGLSGIGKAPS